MKIQSGITHMFLDIGGVILTNGWDHISRKEAAKQFNLNWDEFESRHHLIFEGFENGVFSLEDYLNLVIFNVERSFTKVQFRDFMYSQSKPYSKMIELIKELKAQYHLKIVVVSNESKELNAYRIRKFKLESFVDSFISSCFVHLRKPDPAIFRLALDTAQVNSEQVLYLENTPLFVQIAKGLGIKSILHKDYQSTYKTLESFGLKVPLKA